MGVHRLVTVLLNTWIMNCGTELIVWAISARLRMPVSTMTVRWAMSEPGPHHRVK